MKKIILAVAMLIPMAVGAQTTIDTITVSPSGWETVSGHVSFVNITDRLVVIADGTEVYSVGARIEARAMAGGEWIGLVAVKDFDYSVDVNTKAIKSAVQVFIESDGVRTEVKN